MKGRAPCLGRWAKLKSSSGNSGVERDCFAPAHAASHHTRQAMVGLRPTGGGTRSTIGCGAGSPAPSALRHRSRRRIFIGFAYMQRRRRAKVYGNTPSRPPFRGWGKVLSQESCPPPRACRTRSGKALRAQRLDHALAVVDVHLAAVRSLTVELFFGLGHRAHPALPVRDHLIRRMYKRVGPPLQLIATIEFPPRAGQDCAHEADRKQTGKSRPRYRNLRHSRHSCRGPARWPSAKGRRAMVVAEDRVEVEHRRSDNVRSRGLRAMYFRAGAAAT